MLGPYARSVTTRARLLSAIRAHPGVDRAELARLTGLSWSAVAHHVRAFVRRGEVSAAAVGRRTVYHAGLAAREAALRRLLRTEPNAACLLRRLNDGPASGLRPLSQELAMDRKAVRRYLALLSDAGLVRREEAPLPRFELRAVALDLRDLLR